jgi:hypothetical protein
MRLGENPSKDKLLAYRPHRLGIALLSYIPSLAGYYTHSLEIMEYQIASLHYSTGMDFDLLVFDNGSCKEARSELQHLHHNGWIDVLISSQFNYGKIGALNWIFGAMPNEFICYSDSDVLFRPGWAENSLQILESFPRVGMVSAQPCLDDVLQGSGKAHLGLEKNLKFQSELKFPDSFIVDEYAAGVNLDIKRSNAIKKNSTHLITCKDNGVRAVVGATHMQFTMPRIVAQEILPLPVKFGLGRAEDRNFDRKVDMAGYLHLSTPVAYVWHMGNIPDKKTMSEVQSMGLLAMLSVPMNKPARTTGWIFRILKRIVRIGIIHGIVFRIYNFLFKIYAE